MTGCQYLWQISDFLDIFSWHLSDLVSGRSFFILYNKSGWFVSLVRKRLPCPCPICYRCSFFISFIVLSYHDHTYLIKFIFLVVHFLFRVSTYYLSWDLTIFIGLAVKISTLPYSLLVRSSFGFAISQFSHFGYSFGFLVAVHLYQLLSYCFFMTLPPSPLLLWICTCFSFKFYTHTSLYCSAFFSLLDTIIKGQPVSVGPLESLFPFLLHKLRCGNWPLLLWHFPTHTSCDVFAALWAKVWEPTAINVAFSNMHIMQTTLCQCGNLTAIIAAITESSFSVCTQSARYTIVTAISHLHITLGP